MNPLKINRMTLSAAVWGAIAPDGITPMPLPDDEGLQIQADYQTGSLTATDMGELRAIANYFRPVSVAEVGTYIGRSTKALAAGMRQGVIYTCDASNDIRLGSIGMLSIGVALEQFPKTTSTQMFRKLIDWPCEGQFVFKKQHIDCFYIDGRLSPDDAQLMYDLNPNALIVLDDFEGVEKGVANASLLLGNQFATNFLIYPRQGGKTALMIHPSTLRFVAQ